MYNMPIMNLTSKAIHIRQIAKKKYANITLASIPQILGWAARPKHFLIIYIKKWIKTMYLRIDQFLCILESSFSVLLLLSWFCWQSTS